MRKFFRNSDNFRISAVIRLALAALLLRALIPLGYMPGNLLAGELAVLCPVGMPPAVMHALHHGHHEADEDVVSTDQACPIGTALQPAWLPGEWPTISLQPPAPNFTRAVKFDSHGETVVYGYRSRAPPSA